MGRSKSLGPAAILPAKMMLPDAARSPLSIVAGGPRESPAGSTEDGGPFRSRGTARGYSRNRRLALMLTLLVPLAQLAVISWLIRDHTSDVPNSDEWAMVRLVRATREGHLGLEDFWAFHNTHRVVVPRLTTLALIEITHWHRQILMGFNVAIAVVTGLFLLAAARVTFRSPTFTWLFIVPLSLLVLSMSRYHNWTKPFTDKMWTAFGVALCLWALVVLRRDSTSLATAVSGAFIASLSSIGGFATWIAFLPAVWLRGWRSVAVWVTSAIALIVPYIMDFPANEGTISLNQAPSVGLAFLGAPLGQRDESTAIVAASLSILTSLVLLTGLRLLPPAARNEKQTRATAAWVGLALFALGSGAMIAGGGREGALSSRYHAFSVYWWVALVVVACSLLPAGQASSDWPMMSDER